MKTSLGPVLYYWTREQLLDFYARAATSDIDILYLGEAVCSKRRALRTDDWLALARDLASVRGKQVVLSSLALIEAESELGTLRRQVREIAQSGNKSGNILLEANDMGAVQAARDAGVNFIAGHTLNVYNADTLWRLAKAGAVRWVPPVELSRDAITDVITAFNATATDNASADEKPLHIETEIFAYGRLPLAHSARCFTARAHNLPKDQCGFRCADAVEGMPLATRDGVPLFRLNGIQTQSERHCNLFGEVADMSRRGVDVLRISVSTPDAWATVDRLVAQAHGMRPKIIDSDLCNGYWFGTAGYGKPLSLNA